MFEILKETCFMCLLIKVDLSMLSAQKICADEEKISKKHFNFYIIERWHEISNNMVYLTSKASDQPAHMPSLVRPFACRMNILWLLSYWPKTAFGVFKLKRRLHRYTLVKIPHCWMFQICTFQILYISWDCNNKNNYHRHSRDWFIDPRQGSVAIYRRQQ